MVSESDFLGDVIIIKVPNINDPAIIPILIAKAVVTGSIFINLIFKFMKNERIRIPSSA